jgi:hypothetical protein
MRWSSSLAFAFLALAAGSGPAWAFRVPDSSTAPPTPHQLELAGNSPQPYAMTYGDEAARRLGIQDGKWEAFDIRSSNSLMPSLKGGLDGGRPMIRLQWRQ